MFTGIITAIGQVQKINGSQITLCAPFEPSGIDLGASIACDGCCLTVTSVTAEAIGAAFTVDVSNETLAKTSLGSWKEGTQINMERSLTLGAELGGHMVTGHVDGVAPIMSIEDDGNARCFWLKAPPGLTKFIAPKGSVALSGTSLTVNEVAGDQFRVNLIPHTLDVTTWSERAVEDEVNLEVDLMARYVARLNEFTA